VANGHSYICSTAGTSAASEPTWSGRWPAVTDNSAAWAPYSIVTPATIRSQLKVESTTDQWADAIVGNYILDAISSLEQATKRFLVNRPGATITLTSMVRAEIAIPGLRTPTSVQYVGSALTASAYWLLPDAQQTGVYTGIAFRAYRTEGQGPWWYADPGWWDKALDSPFYSANYGGGYAFSSMPNDTVIVGDWAWEPTFEPGAAVHAVEVLSAFYCMRAPAILADSVITPQGGVVNYASMPPEVQAFVRDWRAGQTAVSVG
jgi:hypothetical protein